MLLFLQHMIWAGEVSDPGPGGVSDPGPGGVSDSGGCEVSDLIWDQTLRQIFRSSSVIRHLALRAQNIAEVSDPT